MASAKKQTASFCLSWGTGASFRRIVSTLAIAQYQRVELVSDQTRVARHTDPNLKNGWGLAFSPNAFLGQLKDRNGNTIASTSFGAIVFGAVSAANGKRNELFYTAGPNFYADGLFG